MNEKLTAYIYKVFKQENGISLPNDELTLKRVTEAIEKAWIELRNVERTEISLPFIFADSTGPKHLMVEISKTLINRLLSEKSFKNETIKEKPFVSIKKEREEPPKKIQEKQKKKNVQNRQSSIEKRDGKSFIRKYQQLEKKDSRNKYKKLKKKKSSKQNMSKSNTALLIFVFVGIVFALSLIIPIILYYLLA